MLDSPDVMRGVPERTINIKPIEAAMRYARNGEIGSLTFVNRGCPAQTIPIKLFDMPGQLAGWAVPEALLRDGNSVISIGCSAAGDPENIPNIDVGAAGWEGKEKVVSRQQAALVFPRAGDSDTPVGLDHIAGQGRKSTTYLVANEWHPITSGVCNPLERNPNGRIVAGVDEPTVVNLGGTKKFVLLKTPGIKLENGERVAYFWTRLTDDLEKSIRQKFPRLFGLE